MNSTEYMRTTYRGVHRELRRLRPTSICVYAAASGFRGSSTLPAANPTISLAETHFWTCVTEDRERPVDCRQLPVHVTKGRARPYDWRQLPVHVTRDTLSDNSLLLREGETPLAKDVVHGRVNENPLPDHLRIMTTQRLSYMWSENTHSTMIIPSRWSRASRSWSWAIQAQMSFALRSVMNWLEAKQLRNFGRLSFNCLLIYVIGTPFAIL
jgi:hypothetical protein